MYAQAMEGALEVWDYSRYNIENYARRVRKTQPRLQYVPFSFLSTKSGVPLGMSLPQAAPCLATAVPKLASSSPVLSEQVAWALCQSNLTRYLKCVLHLRQAAIA